ncbi:hypothetical protein BOTBODRAFT_251677 [Botryobasidium botryosum FD-172 SS1]|uniref:Uncharacterized protein n=1 Tax=Botryobasidium botryosum (strain FD-172 SS1) TaxID=930990 RepID=A0A067ML93_BOTB1|nr:hypothetical protein BOTBODRAFT_251677 [Botryobasidium botryosum FD-172 SS1]
MVSGRVSLANRYFASLRAHAEFVRSHFYGDAADEEDEDGEPIFISPNSYWTPGEKHLFFQSLSRHSRLRPDLIAATVGTKSVLEVCQLLRVLCDAARDVGEDLHDAKRRRVEMEAAVEVSDDWLAFEDIRAQEHINGEADWELAAILATRKRSQQARGGTKRKRGAGEERSTNPKPPSQEAQAAAWKLDDALKNLDVPHLQVLDSLVRTAEEAAPLSPGPSSSRPSRSNSVQPPTEPSSPSPLAEETVIRMTSAERRRLHKRMYMRRRRARETGGVVVDDIARLKPGRRKKTDGVGTPSNAHDAIGSPSEAAPVELSRGGINPNAAADDSPEEDLDSGSAAEPAKQSTKQRGKVVREKAQALFAEAGVDAAMLLRDGLDLFQMSRFGRLSQLYTHALFERTTGGQPPDAADLPPDQDGTGTNNQAQSNNHDDTCDESGDDDGRIAAAATPEQEQEQDVPPIPHPTLHYTTFQLLRAYVVAYVASLVHGAVVSAEQDKRIKEHTKVWRGNFNLVRTHIHLSYNPFSTRP